MGLPGPQGPSGLSIPGEAVSLKTLPALSHDRFQQPDINPMICRLVGAGISLPFLMEGIYKLGRICGRDSNNFMSEGKTWNQQDLKAQNHWLLVNQSGFLSGMNRNVPSFCLWRGQRRWWREHLFRSHHYEPGAVLLHYLIIYHYI